MCLVMTQTGTFRKSPRSQIELFMKFRLFNFLIVSTQSLQDPSSSCLRLCLGEMRRFQIRGSSQEHQAVCLHLVYCAWNAAILSPQEIAVL
jgi:hypothetical protein